MTKDKLIITLSGALTMTAHTAMAQSFTPQTPHFDCGQMLYNNPTTVTLNLRNTSTMPAQIRGVDTGCGCSSPSFTPTPTNPGRDATVNITFDCRQLGHFARIIRVYDTASEKPAEIEVRGQIVEKMENYTGEYPFKLGVLYTDAQAVDFDDIHKGQKITKEIHVLNPTGQNTEPTALRLPPYLKAEMTPRILGPKQKGTLKLTINSKELRDYGLTQTAIYLAKTPADRVKPEKEITVSAVLLPTVMGTDDVKRPNAPRLQMSATALHMSELQRKSKAKDEIELTNTGHSTLEITKLQLFTTGLQVQLGTQKLKPGESTKLKVTAIAKELKKARTRPRILMITNDPNNPKVVFEILR